MYFSIGRKLVRIERDGDISHPFAALLRSDELNGKYLPPGFVDSGLPIYPKPRLCKAEVHEDMLSGTLSVPDKKSFGKHSGFSYYIRENGVVFADDSGLVSSILQKIENTATWREPSVGHFFYAFMETLVEDDLRYIESIEDRLAKLEASVLSDRLEGFMFSIVQIRKEILARSHYYSQLSDVALELLENENEIFDDHSLRLLKHFSDRANSIRHETKMLREYSLEFS